MGSQCWHTESLMGIPNFNSHVWTGRNHCRQQKMLEKRERGKCCKATYSISHHSTKQHHSPNLCDAPLIANNSLWNSYWSYSSIFVQYCPCQLCTGGSFVGHTAVNSLPNDCSVRFHRVWQKKPTVNNKKWFTSNREPKKSQDRARLNHQPVLFYDWCASRSIYWTPWPRRNVTRTIYPVCNEFVETLNGGMY